MKRISSQFLLMGGMFQVANNGLYFPDDDIDPKNSTMFVLNQLSQGMPGITQGLDMVEWYIKSGNVRAPDVFSSEILRLLTKKDKIKNLEESKEKIMEKYFENKFTDSDFMRLHEINQELERYSGTWIDAISAYTLPYGNWKNIVKIKDDVSTMFLQDESINSLQQELNEWDLEFENGKKIDAKKYTQKSFMQLITGIHNPYYKGRTFLDWIEGNLGVEGATSKEDRELSYKIKSNLEERIELKKDVSEFFKKYNIGDGTIESVNKYLRGLQGEELEKFKEEKYKASKEFIKNNSIDKKGDDWYMNGKKITKIKLIEAIPDIQWDYYEYQLGANEKNLSKLVELSYDKKYEIQEEDKQNFLLDLYFGNPEDLEEYQEQIFIDEHLR